MKNVNYTFNVLVKNKILKEYYHNDKCYIEGRKSSEYELYFYNNSPNKILTIFSVDGIGVVDGKTASDKSKGYVISAYQSINVPGWTINNNKVAKFEFNPRGDKNSTYVESLKSEGFDVDLENQGVIGVMVFKENNYKKYQQYSTYIPSIPINIKPMAPWPYQYPYYPNGVRGPVWSNDSYGVCLNASQTGMVSSSTISSLGTSFGEDYNFNTTSFEFEKESSPDWIGIINYDTKTNLRKRGVILEEDVNQAFPDYKSNQEFCHIPKNR